jgi:hypothetical protein
VDIGEALRRGETLRERSERCEIQINTAHRWRHRFLSGGTQIQGRLTAIAEADETFVGRSASGQPERLLERDRAARKRGGSSRWLSVP